MNSRTPHVNTPPWLAALERVHLVCTEFEDAWTSDPHPRIEDFLREPAAHEDAAIFREHLFRELLLCELILRSRDGQPPDVDDYRQRFPQYGELMTGVFDAFREEEKEPGQEQPASQTPSGGTAPVSEEGTPETTEEGQYIEPIRAVEQLQRYIIDDEVRLTSVIGLGGYGKTEDTQTYNELAVVQNSPAGTLEVLWNHSLLWSVTGHPVKGECVAHTCCRYARRESSCQAMQHSLACLGFARFLRGKTHEAAADFATAVQLGSPPDSTAGTLTGADGLLQTYCALRAGDIETARLLAGAAVAARQTDDAVQNHDEYLPYYRWLQGWILSLAGDLSTALEFLTTAEEVAPQQRSLLLWPFVLHTTADVYRRRGTWTAADDYCNRALDLAASRGLLMIELESRILRGRIHLESALSCDSPERLETELWPGEKDMAWEHALADAMICAENALEAARLHTYRWLEQDALALLADCEEAAAAHHSRAASEYRDEWNTLRRELKT